MRCRIDIGPGSLPENNLLLSLPRTGVFEGLVLVAQIGKPDAYMGQWVEKI